MRLGIQQTFTRRQTTLIRLGGLTVVMLAAFGLGSCDHEQTSSYPGGVGRIRADSRRASGRNLERGLGPLERQHATRLPVPIGRRR